MTKATLKQINYIYYLIGACIPYSISINRDSCSSEMSLYYDELLKKDLTQSEATNLIQILIKIKNINDFLVKYKIEQRKNFPEKIKILERLTKQFEEEFEKLRNKYLKKEASL